MTVLSTPILTLALIALLAVGFARGGDRVTGALFATRSEVIAQHGLAATSQPLATQIALDILKQGGTAVDAAIAANAALGLMEPVGCGVGGDLFALVWSAKEQKLYGLNASGRAPLGQTREDLRKYLAADNHRLIPDFGPLSVSVPGCVDGWFELHTRFGRMPMNKILQPTIDYATRGFPVSELIAFYWERGGALLKDYPGFADTFLPGGKAPAKGELHTRPGLARTLTLLSQQGRDAFYRGELTQVMDAFCQRVGCPLRRIDFEQHTSTWVEPISTNYRGYDCWQIPPNGQGLAALQMLNILEGFDLKALGHNSAAYLHTLIEAKKLAFEDRARYYADPAFAQIPLEMLLSKDYAARRRALINPRRAGKQFKPGDAAVSAAFELPSTDLSRLAAADAALREGDTICLATADAEGNMIALIQSNYRGFGSGLCPDGLGFCFQDRGCQFSLDDDHPNRYEPGKRPFHTIIPGFVTRKNAAGAIEPFLAYAVMGGDMQPQGHVQVLCNLIDFGMNLQEAGDAARFYHTGSSEPTGTTMTDGGLLALESGIDAQVRRDLGLMGHRFHESIGNYGGYQAIAVRGDSTMATPPRANDSSATSAPSAPATRVYLGASESRKDGHAAGY